MGKAISDEEIIAALIQHGTIKEAAAAVNASTRTIYDRMNNLEFRAKYTAAKNGILRKAVFYINEKLTDAINTVLEIMNDPDASRAVRLQAAQTIINNAGKFAERLTKEEQDSWKAQDDPLNIFSIV